MEQIDADIYDYPKYYDLVYGSDWKAEFDFLQAMFKSYVSGETKRVFEPACGTGRLLYRFAKAGYEVGGNDLNPKAIEFCNQRLTRHGIFGMAEVGDMTDFRLNRPVDAAFNTINSFRHLETHQQAVDHLVCMTKAIRQGGIYVLGLHLSPLEGETCEEESWSAARGHLTVNSSMWLEERNLPARYETFGMAFDVYTPTKQFRIKNQIKFRTYTAAQFVELVDAVPNMEIESIFDFRYDETNPIEISPSIEDAIFILSVR